MPFSYHPPTRDYCPVCEALAKEKQEPVIGNQSGKASSANNFPFHNWYYFVLGYSPEFPNYLIRKFDIKKDQVVVDPFNGSGTTMVACKLQGLSSAGIEANDYFVDVAKTKLTWDINTDEIHSLWEEIRDIALAQFEQIGLHSKRVKEGVAAYEEYARANRPAMLTQRYISDKPFVKISIINSLVKELVPASPIRKLLELALSSILVSISNVKYGPGFGVTRPKEDADVITALDQKINRMISDLETAQKLEEPFATSRVIHGDARITDKYFDISSVDFMITSPPYPGDHEYTKHTRLELIFMGYAENLEEFRVIKKRMLRGSTTNIYKADKEGTNVSDIESIHRITQLVEERLKEDNAQSGFEKLYTKLIWEYFGGMHLALESAFKVLKPKGKYALLVSDSHAFKMVHIETAKILGQVAKRIGYSKVEIELWQDKVSSSHSYHIPENILILTK